VYEIYLEKSAERDLKRLEASLFRRTIQEIQALNNNPRPAGCGKLAGSVNDWRIRVGDYRVIYEIDDKAKSVWIMRIRHRGEVYR
jgi:mRNA interferase RelE/StbE